MNHSRFLCLALSGMMVSSALQAKVVLPNHFTDNMVLQQQRTLTVHGTASPNSTVTLTTGWSKTPFTVKANDKGDFGLTFSTPKGSLKAYTLTFSDGTSVTTDLNNVLVGEVWLGSGQSNMEMPLDGWGKVLNYEEEIRNANYPYIRLLQVKKEVSFTPRGQAVLNMGGWQECSPRYVPDFSALCYFYAQRLWEELKVPIGVIDDDWGGTVAEAWTSPQALEGVPGFDYVSEIYGSGQSVEEYYRQKLEDFRRFMKESEEGTRHGGTAWYAPEFDDAAWATMNIPRKWEEVIGAADGIVWFRYHVNIPDAWAGSPLTLNLGITDDCDVTYWNGEFVGGTTAYDQTPRYEVPGHLVKPGFNTIAVCIHDNGGDGGFAGGPEGYYIEKGGQRMALAGDWRYCQSSAGRFQMPDNPTSPNNPGVLYNAMIHPLIDFPVRGIIWYQGCANVGRDEQYTHLFRTLIQDWRRLFGQEDMPFYFCQLANFLAPSDLQPGSEWARLREAQANALVLPHTGMAVNIDIGDAADIHPKTKRELGRRLSAIALNRTYGKKCVFMAPVYERLEVEKDKAVLTFSVPKGSEPLVQAEDLPGFIIQGTDGSWHVAKARTIGKNQVEVYSPEVSVPVAVRYGWADNPTCTLRTKSGFPVAPFRTDK